MSLTVPEIARMLEALSELLSSSVQQVYQPSTSELVLELRSPGRTELLLISVDSALCRLHRIPRRPPNPISPFAFQMLCRREPLGQLVALRQTPQDRIVWLDFSGPPARTLVAELTGRHANIFLLDEQQRILGSLRPLGKGPRGLLLGQAYVLPPASDQLILRDRFSQLQRPEELEAAVLELYTLEAARLQRERLRSELGSGIRRELKRLSRRIELLEGDLQRAEEAERHRHFGDLLQIHLNQVPRGAVAVELPDSFTEDLRPIVVPLDLRLSPVENLQRHYKLYRKYDASIPMVLERLEQSEQGKERLKGWLDQLEAAQSLDELLTLQTLIRLPRSTQKRPSSANKREERLPYHRFVTPQGIEIRVGRGAQDNDHLTFRHARGNDFWMHVRNRPGAHVVISARGQTPDLETLLDAGALAMRHSRFSAGDKADVACTRVKYVRKVAGGAPGLVTYTQDKTFHVTLSPERLERLQKLEPVDDEGGRN